MAGQSDAHRSLLDDCYGLVSLIFDRSVAVRCYLSWGDLFFVDELEGISQSYRR
jgi:hypothetical protein